MSALWNEAWFRLSKQMFEKKKKKKSFALFISIWQMALMLLFSLSGPILHHSLILALSFRFHGPFTAVGGGVKVGVSLGKFSWQGFLQNRSQRCQLGSSVARSDDFPDPLGGLTCQKPLVAQSVFCAVSENGNDNTSALKRQVMSLMSSCHVFSTASKHSEGPCVTFFSNFGSAKFQPVKLSEKENCWESRFILLKAERTCMLIYTKS